MGKCKSRWTYLLRKTKNNDPWNLPRIYKENVNATSSFSALSHPITKQQDVKIHKMLSYFKRNGETIVFVLVTIAFVLFYCVNYFIRRYSNRAATTEETTEAELNPRRPPRGLDVEEIESFPSFVYTEARGIEPGIGELNCVVCLNEYTDNETLRLVPPCVHVFHADCVDIWLSLSSTCPICRSDVVP